MYRLLSSLLIAAMLTLVPEPAQAADDWFSDVVATNRTFYPRVFDDFKDFTEVEWRTADEDFEVCWGSVYAPDGTLMMDENTRTNWQTEFNYSCDIGRDWLEWNGLNQYGKRVPTGTYTIKVKYYSEWDYGSGNQDEYLIHTLTRQVTVATGTRWFEDGFSYNGASYDTKRTSGNCRVYRSSGEGVLDCWGGRYAKVGYDFYVQYDLAIKNFKWWARGEQGCCDRGRITKSGVRNGHDLDIDVKVTRWRMYRVWRVGASWMAKNRI